MENCKGSTLDSVFDFSKHSNSDMVSDQDSSDESDDSNLDDSDDENSSLKKELLNNELTFKKIIR